MSHIIIGKSGTANVALGLGALRTKGFLDYPRPGVVKAAEWLFAS